MRRARFEAVCDLRDFDFLDLPQAEDRYERVRRRSRRGSLILTTNGAPNDRSPRFPNPVLAEGVLDRVRTRAQVIPMLGRS